MKKKFFLFLFCFLSSIFALPLQERSIDPEALSQLALDLGIPQDADLIHETQKQWLRKLDKERWDLIEIPFNQRLFVLKWAEEQGFFLPWYPLFKEYEKVVIFGATTSQMQKRLDFLLNLWKEGYRFKEVVWLTGDRPLNKNADSYLNRCQNESEAAHIIWEEADLPERLRQISVLFVATPMRSQEKRPNTEDTIITWLKRDPEPCRVLFISSQPFCGYQFAVLKSTLPESFLFDLAGDGFDPIDKPSAAALLLDSIARWIYQEEQAVTHKRP